MELDFASEKPIFLQIAESIEDAILSGAFPEEGQIPSITEFSVECKINPATALKGINLLVENGTVYKKRGVGMFVSPGALESLRKRRKAAFSESFVAAAVEEAKRLGFSRSELLDMIAAGYDEKEEKQ